MSAHIVKEHELQPGNILFIILSKYDVLSEYNHQVSFVFLYYIDHCEVWYTVFYERMVYVDIVPHRNSLFSDDHFLKIFLAFSSSVTHSAINILQMLEFMTPIENIFDPNLQEIFCKIGVMTSD